MTWSRRWRRRKAKPVMAPFLRTPPFPGHRALPIATPGKADHAKPTAVAELIEVIRNNRVGGSFWFAQPPIPDGRTLVLMPGLPGQAAEMIDRAKSLGWTDKCVIV